MRGPATKTRITFILIIFTMLGIPALAEPAGPSSSPADAAVRQGVDQLKQKQWAAAVETLQKAVQQDPKNVSAHFYLALAYAFVNNGEKSRKEIAIVLELDPGNKRAKELLSTLDRIDKTYMTSNPQSLEHLNKGETFFRAGQFAQAIPEYEAAAAADPKFAKPWVFLGDAYSELHDYPKAIDSYRKAISVDPTDAQPWHFMGDAYQHLYDQTKEVKSLELAIESYKQAVKLDPNYLTASEKLARAERRRAELP